MDKAKREACEKSFATHKAELIQNTDRFLIIDWRKEDGSGYYYVNYIVGTECLADKDSRKCEEWTAKNPYLSCADCPLDKRLIVFERTATKEMVSVLLLGDNENFIFGETVYLTREEAEIALKELKNETNV